MITRVRSRFEPNPSRMHVQCGNDAPNRSIMLCCSCGLTPLLGTRHCEFRSHRRDQIEISCGLVGSVVFMFHNYRMGVFMLWTSVYACHVEFRGHMVLH